MCKQNQAIDTYYAYYAYTSQMFSLDLTSSILIL